MLHIAIVTETFAPEINGVAMTLGHLVDGLRRRGCLVTIVRPAPEERGSCAGDEVVVRGAPLPGYPGLRFGFPAGRRLERLWRQHRPDAVYVATEGPLGWSALLAARRLRLRVVSGFHTNFHQYAAHYRFGWLTGVGRRYLRAFHNRTDATLTASPTSVAQLQGLGIQGVRMLGRGVDTSRFNPGQRSEALRQSWGAGPDDVVLLNVGRVAHEKNLPMVLAAFGLVRAVAPATRCVIVGDGPARGELERAHPDVRFAGMRTGEDLARHYASGDVFVFPSETETFGNVTLEAMASGLAVVAFDYAAAALHVADGETGVVVPLGDHEAFLTATSHLALHPGRARALGRAAAQQAAALGWHAVTDRFLAVLAGDAPAADGLPAALPGASPVRS